MVYRHHSSQIHGRHGLVHPHTHFSQILGHLESRKSSQRKSQEVNSQTKLPLTTKSMVCDNPEQVAEKITSCIVRAPWILDLTPSNREDILR